MQTQFNSALTYFKCMECLSTYTNTQRINECACGSTQIETMGRVTGIVYERTEERCACDKRCTHAMGPKCDCSCGGANHGTGKVIEVTVFGGIVKVTKVDDEALQRAVEYRAAVAAVDAQLEVLKGYISSQPNSHVSWNAYRRLSVAKAEFFKAKKGKIHKGRQEKLASLNANLVVSLAEVAKLAETPEAVAS